VSDPAPIAKARDLIKAGGYDAAVDRLLALIPGGQDSGAIVALLLPVHVALAWALALPRGVVRTT
jgi:hypothetical protein